MKKTCFTNSDGQKIAANFYGNEKNDKIVIYSHGLGSGKDRNIEEKKKWAAMLNNKRISMLLFDFRGCGESEGGFEEAKISNYVDDLDSVIRGVAEMRHECSIGLSGTSLGGVVSLICAHKNRKPAALICPPTDFREIFSMFVNKGGHSFETLRANMGINFKTKDVVKTALKFYMDSKKYDFVRLSRGMKKPFILIHGSEDDIVPFHQSRRIAKESGAALHEIKGCGHRFRGRYFDKMAKITTEFFGKEL